MIGEKATRLIKNLPTMCVFKDAYGEPIDSDDYYKAVDMATEALKFMDAYDALKAEILHAGTMGREVEIHINGRAFRIREVAQ